MDSFNYPDLSSLLEDDITTDTLFEYDMYNTSQEHGLLEPAIETVSSAEGGEEIDAGVVDTDNDIFDFAIENVLSVEADEENENILFNRDPLLPIYEKSRANPCPSKDVVISILEGIPDNVSAKLVPSQPKENVCFMISLNYLEDWKDALSDDLGVWTPTGKRTLYYRRLLSINDRTNIQSVVFESDADVIAFRYLYSYLVLHQKCLYFWQMIGN